MTCDPCDLSSLTPKLALPALETSRDSPIYLHLEISMFLVVMPNSVLQIFFSFFLIILVMISAAVFIVPKESCLINFGAAVLAPNGERQNILRNGRAINNKFLSNREYLFELLMFENIIYLPCKM